MAECSLPSMAEAWPPVTRLMTLLIPNGPSKVALSPVPMLNRSKL